MRAALAAVLGAACASERPAPEGPALEPEVLSLEIAPPGGEYGDLVDGSSLWCGIPPQGGAPYTPILLRLTGQDDALTEGIAVEAIAADAESGEPLLYTALALELLRSNVGDSAGSWVGSEVHLRYEGWSLQDLEGRSADLVVRVTSLAEPTVGASAGAVVLLAL